jgi:hypothetical protein
MLHPEPRTRPEKTRVNRSEDTAGIEESHNGVRKGTDLGGRISRLNRWSKSPSETFENRESPLSGKNTSLNGTSMVYNPSTHSSSVSDMLTRFLWILPFVVHAIWSFLTVPIYLNRSRVVHEAIKPVKLGMFVN